MAGRDVIGSKVRALDSAQSFERFLVVHSTERIPAHFETPPHLQQRLSKPSTVFSNGFRFPLNLLSLSNLGR